MSSSNCCFLTCIQVSQEAGQVVWYAHLFQNFPQFIVIHTVDHKGFGIVNKAEIDVFLELSCFFDDLTDIGNLISGPSASDRTNLQWLTDQWFPRAWTWCGDQLQNEENLGGDENVSDFDFNAGYLGVFSHSKFLEGYI